MRVSKRSYLLTLQVLTRKVRCLAIKLAENRLNGKRSEGGKNETRGGGGDGRKRSRNKGEKIEGEGEGGRGKSVEEGVKIMVVGPLIGERGGLGKGSKRRENWEKVDSGQQCTQGRSWGGRRKRRGKSGISVSGGGTCLRLGRERKGLGNWKKEGKGGGRKDSVETGKESTVMLGQGSE